MEEKNILDGQTEGEKKDVKNEDKDNDNKTVEELKTFTQEQVDALIQDRLKRERKKYADYDELKKKLETYEAEKREKELAELSELDRTKQLLSEKENELYFIS